MVLYTRALILAIEVLAGNWKFSAKVIFIVLRHKTNKVYILFNGCIMSIDLNFSSYLPIEGTFRPSVDDRCFPAPDLLISAVIVFFLIRPITLLTTGLCCISTRISSTRLWKTISTPSVSFSVPHSNHHSLIYHPCLYQSY